MEKTQVKFGEWIERGFNMYKENFGLLVLASLIAVLLSSLTLGVLAGPMMAGLCLITLALFDKREPKPEVGGVFKGFGYFLQTFLFCLVWGLIVIVASIILALVPCIGLLASICLVYVVQAFLMFGLFLIVDKQMAFWPASMESFGKVKTNFWPFLGLCVVSGLIGSIGTIACGIGVFLTLPIQVCILTIAYRESFNGIVATEVVEEPTADTPEKSEAVPTEEPSPDETADGETAKEE